MAVSVNWGSLQGASKESIEGRFRGRAPSEADEEGLASGTRDFITKWVHN